MDNRLQQVLSHLRISLYITPLSSSPIYQIKKFRQIRPRTHLYAAFSLQAQRRQVWPVRWLLLVLPLPQRALRVLPPQARLPVFA